MVDQVGSWHKRGVASAIMSDHEGVDRSVVLSEKDIYKYHLFCAPETVVMVQMWRELLCNLSLSKELLL